MKDKWTDLNIKDKIQYATAVLLIISGIVAAFISIICNAFNIASGVLIYIAQAFITAGGIFGVSVYFKTKLGEFDTRQKNEFTNILNNIADEFHKRYSQITDETDEKGNPIETR